MTVCGPSEMDRAVASAVARAEWGLVSGQSRLGQLWMHKEVFGW